MRFFHLTMLATKIELSYEEKQKHFINKEKQNMSDIDTYKGVHKSI